MNAYWASPVSSVTWWWTRGAGVCCGDARLQLGLLAVARGGVWCHITSACCERSAFALSLSWEHPLLRSRKQLPTTSDRNMRPRRSATNLQNWTSSLLPLLQLLKNLFSFAHLLCASSNSSSSCCCYCSCCLPTGLLAACRAQGAPRKDPSKFCRHVSQEGCQGQRREQQQPLGGQPRGEGTRQRSEGQPGYRAHERRGPSQQTVREQQQRVLRHRFQGERFCFWPLWDKPKEQFNDLLRAFILLRTFGPSLLSLLFACSSFAAPPRPLFFSSLIKQPRAALSSCVNKRSICPPRAPRRQRACKRSSCARAQAVARVNVAATTTLFRWTPATASHLLRGFGVSCVLDSRAGVI